MSQPVQPVVMPGAEAFSADGGPVGIVVSHGFTGTPASMRPWAEQLAAAGFTVRLPRLPGHGTSWQEMNTTTWRDWYGEIAGAYQELADTCEQVFAVGLSMGGSLVTKLAIDQPSVAGLVLVNPAYGTMRRDAKLARFVAPLLKSQKGIGSDIKSGAQEGGYDRTPLKAFVSLQDLWKTILPDLHRLRIPIRLYTSREDHVVDALSAKLLHSGASNATIDHIWLENSYHVATLDNDAQTIFDGSIEFIQTHVRA